MNRRPVTGRGVESDADLAIGCRLGSDCLGHVARCRECGDIGCPFLRRSSSGRNPASAGETNALSRFEILMA